MRPLTDTICAPITGQGPSAVAVLRISGSEAWAIASQVFDCWPTAPRHLQGTYGTYRTGDDGIALPFASGRSYTGEESVELSVHGSSASVAQLMNSILDLGARQAEPGEFTYRAFMNGRIDLTQAEAVRDTIEARTSLQLRAANLQREGALGLRIRPIIDSLAHLRAAVEASVDFSEEVGDLDRSFALTTLDAAIESVERLCSMERASRLLREGVRVAIVGRPNVGKSSLLNAIVCSERAIVSPQPGTTRDYIEESIEIDGLLCVLIDTAGIRASEDLLELDGVDRARMVAENADVVWHVYDSSAGWTPADEVISATHNARITRVANKSDLSQSSDRPSDVCVSALTGDGLQGLLNTLTSELDTLDLSEPPPSRRHLRLLRQALDGMRLSRTSIQTALPDDLVSVGLTTALSALREVTGEQIDESTLEDIFRDFCIGK